MTRVVIMGAAGRDFHNFNVHFRHNSQYEVIAFTATQIPDIAGRKYPAALAGERYPQGIPILPEDALLDLIQREKIEQVVFAYSDVSHQYVMERASTVLATGADFLLLGPAATMLKSSRPIVSVTAVRTGCGKSQTTRRVAQALKEMGKRTVVIRHPMPYGDLAAQACQRFASYDDLDRYHCTIEEREEYEPHLDRGNVVYAGVDYGRILKEAEQEAQVILWDGGNNDFSFYKPDISIVVTDPHRAGHELSYYPGYVNLRMADVVVINKVNTAKPDDVELVRTHVQQHNPGALIIEAASPITVDDPSVIRDKRVLVIEDGPTVTHGGMSYGAGVLAARQEGARELIDPRPFLVGSLAQTFEKYPDIPALLPAMGYGEKQISDLAETIERSGAEAVVIATPIDLGRLIEFKVPSTRVRYELQELRPTTLAQVLQERLG
ncbi:MAG TPA: GTPase, partial [Candidatus Fraserbacteria bacterium]|nr:GTPase [Candidatus Fraserbacteria bacterium]